MIFGFSNPSNSEQYKRHKFACHESKGEFSDGQIAAIKLVNDTYWELLTKRIERNTHYKYPWYWVYQTDIFNECKYTVASKEDMPTHTANMEWIDVDICKKTTKLIDLCRSR